MKKYAENLKTGSIFCQNNIYSSLVFNSALTKDNKVIYVISQSKNSVKPFGLAKITYENGLFVHTSLGTFISQEGSEKQFCLEQGLEWNGEESIDDFCC